MNIVTIDFDIIMAPVIGSYNDLVNTDYPIDEMIERFPYMRSALPDFYIYDYLCQFLCVAFKSMKDLSQVYFIESHEEIIPYIEGEDIHLYNIDHHHDIGYDKRDLTLRIREADCSNWGKYLKELNKIKEYIWIHDKYSEEIEDEKVLKFIDKQYELKDINLLSLGEQVDKIVICYSTPWVPSEFRGIYNVWNTLLDGYKEVRHKNFIIDKI